jgi:hypothetical protein
MGQGGTHFLRQAVCLRSKVSVLVFERLVRVKPRYETTLGVSKKDPVGVCGIARVHPQTCDPVQCRREKSHPDHAQQTAGIVLEHLHHRHDDAAVRLRKPSVQLGVVQVCPEWLGGETMVLDRRRKRQVSRGVLSAGGGARKRHRPQTVGARRPRPSVDHEARPLLVRAAGDNASGLVPLTEHRDLPPSLGRERCARLIGGPSGAGEGHLGQIGVCHQVGEQAPLDGERILDVHGPAPGLHHYVLERGLGTPQRSLDLLVRSSAQSLAQSLGGGQKRIPPTLQEEAEKQADHQGEPCEGNGERASQRKALGQCGVVDWAQFSGGFPAFFFRRMTALCTSSVRLPLLTRIASRPSSTGTSRGTSRPADLAKPSFWLAYTLL